MRSIKYRYVIVLPLLCMALLLVNSCQKSDTGPRDIITLSLKNVDFPLVGGVHRVEYTATSELRVATTPKWLKIYTVLENDKTVLVVETAPNDEPIKRTVTVDVTAGDNSASLVVSQVSDPSGRPLQVLDSMALVDLYYSCDGPNWQLPKNTIPWDLDKPFRGWSGVGTEVIGEQCRVYSLDLTRYGIKGGIPAQMSYLTNLRNLTLSSNYLEDNPFSVLVKLPKIQLINISDNLLSEPITEDLSVLTELVMLDLSANRLVGTLPESISQLRKLEYLYLRGNAFSGSVPVKYIQLTGLKELDLGSNQLTGTFPSVLFSMPSLVKLNLSNNSFTGSIPNQIANLNKIDELDLSTNSFDGQIPDALSAMLNLELLLLANNKLSGAVPESLGDIKTLKILNLSSNNLTALHSTIGGNAQLEYLDISFNTIASLPNSFSELVNMVHLFMYNNKIAAMPDMSRMVALTEWYADNNMLTTVPVGIEKCVNIREVVIRSNKIKLIPAYIKNMTWLEVLDLSDNEIGFSLPEWIGTMPRLRKLHLANNNITGTIPESILGARALTSLLLSGNHMGGVLPLKVLDDLRWKGEAITVTSEKPPFQPVTLTLPGVWFPQTSICPQQSGGGFTNCGFSHAAQGAGDA